MGEVKPLASGPLTPCEQTVLAARRKNLPLLAAAAGVSEQQLEDAVAQLTRRGLIPCGHTSRTGTRTVRVRRSPGPTPPAA